MLHPLDVERWPDVPSHEQWATPPASRPPHGPVVNRWGDTAEMQRQRREDLSRAMEGWRDEEEEPHVA
jgi:hypothetical protein